MSDSQASIPMAHREYEKILVQLEAECRMHIKCEQQMKLHIENLQEKIDNYKKEIGRLDKEVNLIKDESEKEVNTLNKIIKTLEEELAAKRDKLKEFENQKSTMK